MPLYLFTTVISFIINALLIVPFINFLYTRKIQRAQQQTKDAFNKSTPIFDKFNKHKAGTPVGGGILIISTTSLMFLFFMVMFGLFNIPLTTNFPSLLSEIRILLFTFISFALLGIYDDLTKIFFWKKNQFFGISLKLKLFLEIILGLIISVWLYTDLKISIIHVPFLGVFDVSYFYILFSTFTIVAFANAVNITDGLDGLATGVLMISLASFWIIAGSIADVPTSLFIAIWLGGLIAFLYFNIYPARIFLGDTGSLSFGAAFAVVGLILGKAFSLPIIGLVFIAEIGSSLIQLLSKRFRKKKAFAVAPLHLYLQNKGWEEPKIVMRFWLITIMCSVFGLMIAFLK